MACHSTTAPAFLGSTPLHAILPQPNITLVAPAVVSIVSLLQCLQQRCLPSAPRLAAFLYVNGRLSVYGDSFI